MILEGTQGLNDYWFVTHVGDYWGCITNSTIKEDATAVVLMNIENNPYSNSTTGSMYYGFIATSYEELISEILSRGYEFPTLE
jgi:hypothetical protein